MKVKKYDWVFSVASTPTYYE